VVLERVSVRAIDHDAGFVLGARLLKRSSDDLDMFFGVVRTL